MSKMNLKTQAYNTIRQKIVTCEYAPGTFLNEELLTTELGLSRTPVRDALSRLEQEGLIEIKPKKGIIVMPLSINTINMIFEVRQLYEPYILLNYGNALSEDNLRFSHFLHLVSLVFLLLYHVHSSDFKIVAHDSMNVSLQRSCRINAFIIS